MEMIDDIATALAVMGVVLNAVALYINVRYL